MLQRQPRARRLGQSVIGIEKVVRPERFELPTLWFEARCSIQLSYGRVSWDGFSLRSLYHGSQRQLQCLVWIEPRFAPTHPAKTAFSDGRFGG
jgi:hypothetical protein